MERENMKDCHEILQMFRNSKGVTKYLVTRAVVQLSVGILLCALLIWIYLYHLMGPEIKCTALGMHHSCIVPLSSNTVLNTIRYWNKFRSSKFNVV